MKSGKFLFIAMIFLVSILCISAVSAADDAASDVIADNADEAVLEESIDDANLQESEDDENVLSDGGEEGSQPSVDPPMIGSFDLLNKTVNNGSDVVDLKYNYYYEPSIEGDLDLQDGIIIFQDVTINGNGHTISGISKARIFFIPSDVSVVFKNINFIYGNATVDGGVIPFNYGGAICVYEGGNCTIVNCTFSNNYAEYGGAICVFGGGNCAIVNSTFSNNNATMDGGSISIGEGGNSTIVNSNFSNNYAEFNGGATSLYDGNGYCTAINCSFTNNEAGEFSGAMDFGTAIDCNFTQNSAKEGGAKWGDNATNCNFIGNNATKGGAISNGYAYSCSFKQNNATEDGGALYEGYVENCTFTANSVEWNGGAIAHANATNCTFTANSADGGGAIYNGSAVDCTFTANSAGGGGAICLSNATNCIFTNNTASYEGGAIENDWNSENYAINCTFINNKASSSAGAMHQGNAINCTFTGNRAGWNGGALDWLNSVINCNFTNNTASNEGGAIYSTNSVKNSNFIGNKADTGGAIAGTSYIENCTFISNSAYRGGAISSATEIKNCTFILNTAIEEGTNDIGYGQNDTCNFIVPTLSASNFKTTYNYGEKFNFKIATADQTFDGIKTVISIYKNGAFVANYTALSGQGWVVKLAAGTYTAVLNVNGSNLAPITKTITVAKNPTKLTASAVTAVYNNNKYLVITLKDGKGKALSGIKVTVTLGTAKTYKTNKNGQIKINVGKLVPKTYTAKIKYAGTANYIASTKSVKVVVKKATPKMTAKAKSFKTALKTKKYTITLKNNKGKVMKSTKVSLTVNKKTYTVKTNKKGIATFKITNLKKKGKYTAVIKYAGNKYYKKLTKKATITAK